MYVIIDQKRRKVYEKDGEYYIFRRVKEDVNRNDIHWSPYSVKKIKSTQLQKVYKENEKLVLQINGYEAIVGKMQDELDAVRANCGENQLVVSEHDIEEENRLKKRIEDLEKDLAKYQEVMNNGSEILDLALEIQNKEDKKDVEKESKEVQALIEDLDKCEEIRAELEQAKRDLLNLRTQYGGIADRNIELDQQNAELQDILKAKDDAIRGLQEAIARDTGDTAGNTGDQFLIQRQEDRIRALSDELQEVQAKLDQCQATLEENMEKVHNEAQEQVNEIGKEAENMLKQLHDLDKEVEEQDILITNLKAQLAQKQIDILDEREEIIEERNAEIEELDAEIERHKEDIKTLRAEREHIRDALRQETMTNKLGFIIETGLVEEIEKLTAERAEILRQITELQATVERQLTDNRDLGYQNESLKVRLTALLGINEQLKKQVNSEALLAEIEKLKTLLKESEENEEVAAKSLMANAKERNDLETWVRQLEMDNQKLMTEDTQARFFLNMRDRIIKEQKIKIDNSDNHLMHVEVAYEGKLKKKDKEIASISIAAARLKAEVKRLQYEKKNIATQLDLLKRELQNTVNVSHDLDELQKRFKAVEERRQLNEKELSLALNRISELQTLNEKQVYRDADLRREITALETKNDKLEYDNRVLNFENNELKKKMNDLIAQLVLARAEQQNLAIETGAALIEGSDDQLASINDRLNELNSQLQKQLDSATEKLQECTINLNSTTSVLEDTKAESEQSVKELEKCKKRLGQHDETVNLLDEEIKRLEAENKVLEGKNAELASEFEQINSELIRTRTENEELKGQIQELKTECKSQLANCTQQTTELYQCADEKLKVERQLEGAIQQKLEVDRQLKDTVSRFNLVLEAILAETGKVEIINEIIKRYTIA